MVAKGEWGDYEEGKKKEYGEFVRKASEFVHAESEPWRYNARKGGHPPNNAPRALLICLLLKIWLGKPVLCQKRSEKRRRVCAVDSTGFSIRRFVRWFDVRHGKRKRRKDFLKLHFIVDCKSLLILSFKVTPPFKSDGRQVEYLLGLIGELGRLCADKAYLSRKICNLVAKHGGKPYISIKKNVVRIRAQGSKAWREMLVMYQTVSEIDSATHSSRVVGL